MRADLDRLRSAHGAELPFDIGPITIIVGHALRRVPHLVGDEQ